MTHHRIFFLFIFLLNLLQSAFTDLTGDEALYWMHWKNLDWGYRDHPPVIGVMIGLGYSIFKNEFGVRLLCAIANTITVWQLWRLTKPQSFFGFALLVLSIPVFSIYGFMATPDVPLMISAVFYLNAWKNFINLQNTRNTLFLGITMAALVWSKYHGLFLILFLLLPITRLWFNKHFWLAAVTGIFLFSPHIIWQIVNDLPTIKFHLNDRNSDAWEMKHILGYVGGQFLVFNPIVIAAVIVMLIRTKAEDEFSSSLRWFIIGLFSLFFFNSFRGRVEPHWTAPLALAIVYLLMNSPLPQLSKSYWKYALMTFAITVFAGRFALVFDFIPTLHRDFHRDKDKMAAIHFLAGADPVCFMNSYQNPALYSFYTRGVAHSINNVEGGKNQYDYWSYNEHIHQMPFLFVASYDAPGFEKKSVGKFNFDVRRYDDLPVLHQLYILTDDWLHNAHAGDTIRIPASIINRNSYALQLSGGTHGIRWYAMFNHKKPNEANPELVIEGLPQQLDPGESERIILKFKVPDLKGKNYLFFATQVDDLPATYQSNKLRMMIDTD